MRIVGRDTECARLTTLLHQARAGCGRTVVLRGEPGIGKTALLNHLAEQAEGCTVVRATGVEFESELALASLSELIGPLSDELRELPDRYASVLASLVPQKADDADPAPIAAADRHAIYAATLALLTNAAARRPLVCLIDDAHWVDKASAAALLFTARRLLADAVLIVFATRDVPEFDAPGIETLHLNGLDEKASLQLLARTGTVSALAGARLAALTMGNPLALLELPRVLPLDSQGLRELVEPLPTTTLLQRAFAAPLVSMSALQRQALLVCAAAGNSELEVVARALGSLGVDLAALDEGTVSGLVRVTGRTVTFRHPLIRSAVYAQAGPGERRQAHAALAEASTSPGDEDRRAWHRGCAAVGPDEQVATALVATAERARGRGGIVAQATALERAAELTEEPVLRVKRICAAASIWSTAGALDHSEALLDQADVLAGDSVTARLEVLGDRAYHAVLRGCPGDVFDALVAEAETAGPEDRLAAGRMLSLAMNAPLARWDVAGTLEVCTKVMALTSSDGQPNPEFPKGAVRLALAQVLAGLPAGAELARACVPVCERHVPNGACAELAEVLTSVEEYDLARRMIDHDIDSARDVGDIALLAYSLPRRARLELRVGRPLAAYGDALECAGVADALAQRSAIAVAQTTLAQVTAVLGRTEDCVAHAAEALRGCPDDLESAARVRAALGLVALASGRIDAAIVELRQADEMLREVVEPAAIPVAADLVEALARAGRLTDARRVLDRFEAAVIATGRRGRRAAALRCRALLARGAGAGPLFAAALAAHEEVGEPLERARTLLCQGQWLRRAKRRQEAHEPLAAALEIFESAGARLWAEQTRHELTVLGLRSSRPTTDRPELGVLTPQELRIAWAAAQGQTSREIAAEVLLSVRTVDYHLGNVYRKLAVSSRRALIQQLGGPAKLPA